MMEALVAEGLSKCYGEAETRVCALSGISIRLESGKIVALLGPSGSGKSTLIKALGLGTPPDSGDIWMRGKLVVRDGNPRRIRRGCVAAASLGFVFQKANLIPFLTARENVEIACEIGGEENPRARAAELLEYLGVRSRAEAMRAMLSGGEQQRVAIARALANRPSLTSPTSPRRRSTRRGDAR